MKYNRLERVDWESCTAVLGDIDKREHLTRPWP